MPAFSRSSVLVGEVFVFAFFLLCIVSVACASSSVTREITSDDIAPLFLERIEESAPWNVDEMEIKDLRIYPEKIRIPVGNTSFDIRMPSNGRYIGKISARITVMVDGVAVRRLRACCDIEVYRDVLCATRSIRRGDMISDSDLEFVRRPLSKLRGAVVSDPLLVSGMAAARSIRPGQVITENLLTKPKIIFRGSRVIIEAKTPFLNIRTPGIVMQDGAAGDIVAVRNIASKREITAMVIDSKTVRVLF
jgi:flagella basal body P-ring formation protein FlgA